MNELDKLLSKMNYCKENYYQSPLVHAILMRLLQGTDPLLILDNLLKEAERIQKEYRDLMMKQINSETNANL
jgi:hypothetical protein